MSAGITSTEYLIILCRLAGLAFVFAGLHWYGNVERWGRRGYLIVAFALAVLGCAYLAVVVAVRIDMKWEWDFLNYWLAGRIAAEGLPIYEAASYLHQPLPFGPSKQFFAEVIFVGTMYTPPAVLLFLPLGFFEYREAFVLWSILQGVVLAAVTVLMKREFFRDEPDTQQPVAWFAVICLVVFFPPVKETLYTAQVNLIMALLFMLLWLSRSRLSAGVWIGLGACLKPLFGILVLWLILRKRFGAMVLAAVTVGLAFASAAVVFGSDDLMTYFLDNPVARAPAHLYTQYTNQSALAVLRRATGAEQWSGSPLLHAPYIAFALLVTAITAWSVLRCGDDRWALIACLALGLLLAPQTLYHYSAVLLPAMTFMVAHKGSKWLGVTVVITLFALASLEGTKFWLNLGVWMIAVSYPWWSNAISGNFTARPRKTVSNHHPNASGSAQDQV